MADQSFYQPSSWASGWNSLKPYLEKLGSEDRQERITTLAEIAKSPSFAFPPFGKDVNNHVHTRYSFSPYTPTEVVFYARQAGLQVVGSVDHDSIGAAGELKEAASLLQMGSTVGVEVRVSFLHTEFASCRLNNPDTVGNAYMVIHGLPESAWESVANWLKPIHKAREKRNRDMVSRLNELLAAKIGEISYDRDILPVSWAAWGGSVTERHILKALALRLYELGTKPEGVIRVLEQELKLTVPPRIKTWLLEPKNPHFIYDVLGVLKAEFLPCIFMQPNERECPPVEEVTRLATQLGGIPAYAYLGDVSQSPTGDKKAEKFEDSYLKILFAALPALGFQAVTYMPPRNTSEQLKRVQSLAIRYGLMEISGVDINSSRQTFTCPEILKPEFAHLVETTWALVGHEVVTKKEPKAGIFGEHSPYKEKPLQQRIEEYAQIGREASGALSVRL